MSGLLSDINLTFIVEEEIPAKIEGLSHEIESLTSLLDF